MKRTASVRAIAIWAAAAMFAAGCGGDVSLGDDGAGGRIDHVDGAAGFVSADAGTPSAGRSATTADGESLEPARTCSAACGDAAGPVQELRSVAEFYDAIVGKWRICSGGPSVFADVPDDVIGVEYAAPARVDFGSAGSRLQGNMYYLVEGDEGPVRGMGFDYQLTYSASGEDADEEVGRPLFLYMQPTPTSQFGGGFQYAPCPREWALEGGNARPGGRAILVPLE